MGPPVREEFLIALHLNVWNLEGNDLVRVSSKQQVLILLVPGLLLLLIGRHESVSGLASFFYFWVFHLPTVSSLLNFSPQPKVCG